MKIWKNFWSLSRRSTSLLGGRGSSIISNACYQYKIRLKLLLALELSSLLPLPRDLRDGHIKRCTGWEAAKSFELQWALSCVSFLCITYSGKALLTHVFTSKLFSLFKLNHFTLMKVSWDSYKQSGKTMPKVLAFTAQWSKAVSTRHKCLGASRFWMLVCLMPNIWIVENIRMFGIKQTKHLDDCLSFSLFNWMFGVM